MKPLSVLLVSTSYPRDSSDWRARFIADMVTALAARDDVRLSLWSPSGEIPSHVQPAWTTRDVEFLAAMSDAGGIAHLLRNSRMAAVGHAWKLLSRLRQCYRRNDADLLHINWLQNALPLPPGEHRPVLVTVLGSDYRLLGIPGMTALLRRALHNRPVCIAPNAEWMVPVLVARFGDIAEVKAIPFGIEKSWFSLPRKASACTSGKWLAVARITRGKIGQLFDWGQGLFDDARSLHLLGPHQEESLQIPAWVHFHGPTYPEALQSDWFPEATGLISLSQHDEGRPQVMLEAMAAGLPIIASSLPAHRDIIRHGETGFLVSSKEELQDALEFLSVPANNQAFGAASRAAAISRYGTWEDCASRYRAAYAKLLGR